MKVGIVTFYNAHNYGAVWQAFALKRYLEKTGNQVEIIQYHNPNIAAAYPKHLHLRLGKKDFIIPSRWGRSLEEYKRIKYSKEEWNVQYQKFEEFIKVYLCNNSDMISLRRYGRVKFVDTKRKTKQDNFVVEGYFYK